MDIREIIKRCDHTLLRQTASVGEIKTLCDEAIAYCAASVCIPPCHVKGAARYAAGKLPICTTIGFPNGNTTSKVKAFEAQDAVANGADEIDMVVNLSMVRDRCWSDVSSDIAAVRKACPGKILKVIIEACLLSENEKRQLCMVVYDSGADYIKTSTGFASGGATREDVSLLRELCPPSLKVKAAGGISTLEDAADFIRLGADRLGASRVIRLASESDPPAYYSEY
jgi:deoxyribose-phosphate aldolase